MSPHRTLEYFTIWSILLLTFLTSPIFSAPVNVNSNRLCAPPAWRNILVFYSVNYLAHAGTIPAPAGAKWYATLRWSALALFLPFAGLGRSAALIYRTFIWRGNAVRRALASDAVIVMARSDNWEPSEKPQWFYVRPSPKILDGKPEDGVSIVLETDNHSEISVEDYVVHGHMSPPLHYSWILPTEPVWRHILMCEERLEAMEDIQLARSRSWFKMAASILQLIYACITLYRTRGNQIERYGYAAFGFSVFPFALMSLCNLICVGPVGEYPCIFALKSAIMNEAESHEGKFIGAVGSLETIPAGNHTPKPPNGFIAAELSTENPESGRELVITMNGIKKRFKLKPGSLHEVRLHQLHRTIGINEHVSGCPYHDSGNPTQPVSKLSMIFTILFLVLLPLLVLVIPHVFIFLVSGFRMGESTVAQRAWMMAWLCVNQVSYFPFALLTVARPGYHISWIHRDGKVLTLLSCILLIAPIGGYVEVGMMLKDSMLC